MTILPICFRMFESLLFLKKEDSRCRAPPGDATTESVTRKSRAMKIYLPALEGQVNNSLFENNIKGDIFDIWF